MKFSKYGWLTVFLSTAIPAVVIPLSPPILRMLQLPMPWSWYALSGGLLIAGAYNEVLGIMRIAATRSRVEKYLRMKELFTRRGFSSVVCSTTLTSLCEGEIEKQLRDDFSPKM